MTLEANISIAEVASVASKSVSEALLFNTMIAFKQATRESPNRRALPAPTFNETSSVKFVAPRNVVEEQLVEIWKSVLKRAHISVVDSFFDLGNQRVARKNKIEVAFAVKNRSSYKHNIYKLYSFVIQFFKLRWYLLSTSLSFFMCP